MMVRIPDVLTADQVMHLRAELETLPFADGAATAGVYARIVKHNEQAEQSPQRQRLQEMVSGAIFRNALFTRAARPYSMRPILFSRYRLGMEYGTHVDNVVMPSRPPMRTDLSFTLFLSDPDGYEGGELVIEGEPEVRIKLPAGHMILYPSSSLHGVSPVTRGERLAAVSWVQSMVRDPARRQILFDLETVRQRLFQAQGKTREFDLLTRSFSNLYRMWVET